MTIRQNVNSWALLEIEYCRLIIFPLVKVMFPNYLFCPSVDFDYFWSISVVF